MMRTSINSIVFVVGGLMITGCSDSTSTAAKKIEEGAKKAASEAKEAASEAKEGAKEAVSAAKEAVLKADQYRYRDRRNRKRDFRRLWIIRIGAAARLNQLTYSQFINGLKNLNIALDRKMLAEMAVRDAAGFAELAAKVKAVVENQRSKIERSAPS